MGTALLISGRILAQNGDQVQTQIQNGTQTQSQVQSGDQTQAQLQTGDQLMTRKRDRLHTQDQTGDKLQKQDRLRIHDQTQLKAQDKTGQGSMVKKMNKSQVRTATKGGAAGVNASQQSAMRMRSGVRAGRK